MYTQIQQMSKDPLQSSQNYVIPIQFEDPALSAAEKEHSSMKQAISKQEMRTRNKECRICLEGDEEQSKFVKPCRCAGSIEFVHVHCLIQWIRRRIITNSLTKAKCELCDTQFNYKVATQRIFDCNQLRKHYNKEKRGLICFASIYGILLLFFIAVLVLVIVGNSSQALFIHSLLSSGGGTTLIVSFMIIYCIGLVVVTVLFISQYMVREELAIVDVMRFKEPKSLAKNYKIYFGR